MSVLTYSAPRATTLPGACNKCGRYPKPPERKYSTDEYREDLHGTLTEKAIVWCEDCLQKAGMEVPEPC